MKTVSYALLFGVVIWFFLISPVLLVNWSGEPEKIDIKEFAQKLSRSESSLAVGQVTTAATIYLVEMLLSKPGGFINNDIIIPSILMDNMPNYEVAIIRQLRIMAQVLRNEHSRPNSPSKEDPDLVLAETLLTTNTDFWLFPSAESQYKLAGAALKRYFIGLGNTTEKSTQFYARADNLVDYLKRVDSQLGGAADKLSANVGQAQIDDTLGGDAAADQSTPTPEEMWNKTPFMLVDDVWWDVRGTTASILILLEAHMIDFNGVLEDKNAVISMKRIIRELEATQKEFSSPMVANGDPLGWLPNYSSPIGQHIGAAHAGVIKLINLLEAG